MAKLVDAMTGTPLGFDLLPSHEITTTFPVGAAGSMRIEDILLHKVAAVRTTRGYWIPPGEGTHARFLRNIQGILGRQGGYFTQGPLEEVLDENGQAWVVFEEPALTVELCQHHQLRPGDSGTQPNKGHYCELCQIWIAASG